MKNYFKLLFLLIWVFNSNCNLPKILHISFHRGCIREIEFVAKCLDWDLTSLFVHDLPRGEFDGSTKNDAIYNIGSDRAKNIWEKHKDYFHQFDLIITSDTAPLSRIFLQNNYQGKLIIWVCNRFDYFDGASLDCDFPDKQYYDLLKQATSNPNVKFVAYNEFESFYALAKGVNIGNCCIKPCGFSWGSSQNDNNKAIESVFFIPPYVNNQNLDLLSICKKYNIAARSFEYKGPDDLKNFKGIINIPGAWSNLALFENLSNGILYLVPSQKFMLYLLEHGAWMPNSDLGKNNLNLSEWYNDNLKDVIIYFDSWRDLKNKINSINLDDIKKRCLLFSNEHKIKMLNKWDQLIKEIS